MTIPGYDAWKLQGPPCLEGYPDEACEGCGKNDLGDMVAVVGGRYLCEECAPIKTERCDQCGYWRCRCPEER